jgi:DNA-binding NarL/FixJ family response regulator
LRKESDQKMKILLADNKSEILSALRLFIEQEAGLSVVAEVVDVTELIISTLATQPDIVLLDWELPGLKKLALPQESGKSPVPALRAHCPHVKVIGLSSDPDARNQALVAGADAFVSKGNPPDELLELIRKISNGSKHDRDSERGDI